MPLCYRVILRIERRAEGRMRQEGEIFAEQPHPGRAAIFRSLPWRAGGSALHTGVGRFAIFRARCHLRRARLDYRPAGVPGSKRRAPALAKRVGALAGAGSHRCSGGHLRASRDQCDPAEVPAPVCTAGLGNPWLLHAPLSTQSQGKRKARVPEPRAFQVFIPLIKNPPLVLSVYRLRGATDRPS